MLLCVPLNFKCLLATCTQTCTTRVPQSSVALRITFAISRICPWGWLNFLMNHLLRQYSLIKQLKFPGPHQFQASCSAPVRPELPPLVSEGLNCHLRPFSGSVYLVLESNSHLNLWFTPASSWLVGHVTSQYRHPWCAWVTGGLEVSPVWLIACVWLTRNLTYLQYFHTVCILARFCTVDTATVSFVC